MRLKAFYYILALGDFMNLFTYSKEKTLKRIAPLAVRMRPKTLEGFVGQNAIMGKGKYLRKAIEADMLGSLIFYGPPGTGKTSLAQVIANLTKAHFESLNAVTSGVADIRRIIKEAEERLGMYQQKTILFIDEIHRFNKSQQDALLPSVEEGSLILIGATTENPYFEINGPLRSRSKLFQLTSLTSDQVRHLILKAIKDADNGLGNYKLELTEAAKEHLVKFSAGDARVALNSLEMAVVTTLPNEEGVRIIDLETMEDCLQRQAVRYDKDGDYHYDVISAFIKSIRGSDPDATIHYLARMLDAGEDPKYIARRMIVHSSEDIGLADPQALIQATNAFYAIDVVGMPEARLNLAQAALYLALAPKSNSVIKAIDAALEDVRTIGTGEVPPHLANTEYQRKGNFYPGAFSNDKVNQQYLPDKLKGKKYFSPLA